MHLRNISGKNFRNLREFNLELKPGINLIWGNNAQGKTNLIEALFFLGNLKGFRGNKNIDFIHWQEHLALLKGVTISPLAFQEIQIKIEPSQKKAQLNGKSALNAKEFFTAFPVVIFSPEKMTLFEKGPSGRRAFLDRAVFLMEDDYLEKVRRYTYVLKTRNFLLREKKDKKELEVWTEAFIETALPVISKRNKFLKDILPEVENNHYIITERKERIDFEIKEETDDHIETNLRKRLEKSLEREKNLGYTIIGPHTEGPVFLLNGKPIQNFSSQGQKKTFLISFKISQLNQFYKKKGYSPVFLLDDLGSELDKKRIKIIFDLIKENQKQVFFTATDPYILKNMSISPDTILKIKNGEVQKIS